MVRDCCRGNILALSTKISSVVFDDFGQVHIRCERLEMEAMSCDNSCFRTMYYIIQIMVNSGKNTYLIEQAYQVHHLEKLTSKSHCNTSLPYIGRLSLHIS